MVTSFGILSNAFYLPDTLSTGWTRRMLRNAKKNANKIGEDIFYSELIYSGLAP